MLRYTLLFAIKFEKVTNFLQAFAFATFQKIERKNYQKNSQRLLYLQTKGNKSTSKWTPQ